MPDDTPRSNGKFSNRRSFIKATGAGVLGTALAGCSGDGGDGGGGDGDGGGGGDGGSQQTTITYHSRGAAQTDTAESQMEDWISEFEEQNPDITVDMSPTQGLSNQQQKYRQMFNDGELPVLFEIGGHDVGPFATDEYFRPIEEWTDRVDSDIHDQVKHWIPQIETTFGPADIGDPNALCYPGWQSPFSTMVGRRSHYEEAGLDPDEDFPPESYEEFRSQAQALQEDASSDHAVILSSTTTSTIQNGIGLWSFTADNDRGREFNDDWDEAYMGNDVWLEQTKRYVDTYQQDFTTPESIGTGPQDSTLQVARGFQSLTWVSNQLIPQVRANAPEPFENDDMMFGTHWHEDGGSPGTMAQFFFWLTQQPDGVSDEVWERKTDAAVKLIEFLLSKEKQMESIESFGQYPMRADVVEELMNEHDEQSFQYVGLQIGEESDYLWPAQHYIPLTYGDAPQIGQQAMQGDITPEEACEQWMSLAQEELSGE